MNVLAIVQARMGSTRLPNKVMREIDGIPLIELLLTRLSQSKAIDQIVLATSTDSSNFPLLNHVESLGYPSFQGSEDNVLERFEFGEIHAVLNSGFVGLIQEAQHFLS